MAIKELQAYELLREEGLSDIQSVGYLLRHRKSGARIMVIANDDFCDFAGSPAFFMRATSQSPCLHETLATAAIT